MSPAGGAAGMHCLQNLSPRSHRFLAIVLVVGSALLPASAGGAGTPPAEEDGVVAPPA